jgi:hypothetical protein
MSENPDSLVRMVEAFCAAEPDARNSGLYAAKPGYHNTRRHHILGIIGGSPDDYSIRLEADRDGSADKAAACDISFDSARLRGDFTVIAKYSRRLYDAFQNQDRRLFIGGQPVVREFFGNTDNDRDVEGYSLSKISTGRPGTATSDSTHLWHIHISFHRRFAENQQAADQILSILLAQTETPEDDDMTPEQAQKLDQIHAATVGIPSPTVKSPDGTAERHSLGWFASKAQSADAALLAQVGALRGTVETLAAAVANISDLDADALVLAVRGASEAGARAALEAGVVDVDITVRDREPDTPQE